MQAERLAALDLVKKIEKRFWPEAVKAAGQEIQPGLPQRRLVAGFDLHFQAVLLYLLSVNAA